MLKKSFFSLLIFFVILSSAQAKNITYDEVVSLGYNCQVTWQLEANGMRKVAYPLDWVVTPYESLLYFISQRGAGFLNQNQLSVIGPYSGDESRLHVIDSVYGIETYHDFLSLPPLSNYAEIKAKYDRRIERLFALLNSKKRVLFVREGSTRTQIEYLDDLIHSSFPKLNFTILAVHHDEDYHLNWGLKRVKNFHLTQVEGDWRGDCNKWKEILSQFSVKPLREARAPEEVW